MWHDIHQQKWKWKLIHIQDLNQIDWAPQAGTVKMSDRINRHRSSHDIDIKPCIDYLFKVSFKNIWKHRLSLQSEFVEYLKTAKQSDILHKLKVIASEDWNGMREDFKMASDVITFRVDYAPRVSLLKYLFIFVFAFIHVFFVFVAFVCSFVVSFLFLCFLVGCRSDFLRFCVFSEWTFACIRLRYITKFTYERAP